MVGRYPSFQQPSIKELIFTVIALAGKDGISKKELVDKVWPINQSTVYRDTKQLEKEKRIRIIRDGQRTRYVATSKAQSDIRIAAVLLNWKFMNNILLQTQKNTFLDKLGGRKQEVVSLHNAIPYIQPKSQLEKVLSQFSNQLGAYITYVLIKAMDPDSISSRILQATSEKEKKMIKEDNMNITEQWINLAISSRLTLMLGKFRNLLEPFGFVPNILTKKGAKKQKNLGFYALDEQSIMHLNTAFERLYSPFYHKLEEIINNLSPDIK